MNIQNVYAGIMTADIKAAAKWYENLLGRKSDYHPMAILHEWDFPDGGVLQLVEDKHRAGHSSITLMVENIEELRNNLAGKNFNTEQQTDSEIARTLMINDPENNRITFAENRQGR